MRDEDGKIIAPHVRIRTDETIITERHHAEALNVGALARQVLAGERQVPTPVYRDTTADPQGLQDALDRIEAAQDAFEQLPAAVRLAADNDLVRLETMLQTEDGVAELVAAGLDLGTEVTDQSGEQMVADEEANPTPLTASSPEGETATTSEEVVA